MRIPDVPYAVAQWYPEHPGEQIPNGYIFTQPWPTGLAGGRRDQVIYYQTGTTGPTTCGTLSRPT